MPLWHFIVPLYLYTFNLKVETLLSRS
jgi:hypothetical protein